MPQFIHPSVTDHADYTTWEQINIADNKLRNLAVVRLVHETKTPRIVFVRTKRHQQQLLELLPGSITVNDETPADKANADLQKLRSGLADTLISTPIYRQGVDIPEIATVINAAGGKATIDVIQKVGRGSRIRQPDGSMKETFEVYDVFDVGCGCEGELHKSCEWLYNHSKSRRKAYEQFGYVVRSEK
jgi:superfamily II DNA or RNA helicase